MPQVIANTVPAHPAPAEAGAPATPPPVDRNPCNNNALRKATRHLGQLFDDVIGNSGLRAAQHGLLHHIKEMRGPTMKELATILVMDLSALGHTLKPLERDGFINLVVDDRDKRAKRIHLTAAGEAKLAETRQLWRVAQDRVDTALGPEKSRQMREMLAEVASKEFGEAFWGRTRLGE